jgi:hypothetical protein
MAKSSENWSERRRTMAPRVTSVLYGVIAVISVDLAYQPGERADYGEAAWYILLLGIAMTLTRAFVTMVSKESEIGAHLPVSGYVTIVLDSMLVMVFPVVTDLVIGAAALSTAKWPMLLNVVLYFGILAVFLVGFLSSYILDRNIRLGLTRGFAWAIFIAALVALKKLA